MKLKVMKFGGTSLKSVTTRQYVYSHIQKYIRNHKIILVVSALGRYPNAYATDTLLSYASEHMSKEEKAWMASLGEQFASLRICAELLDLGYRARALSYVDAGIISNSRYEYADISELNDKKIRETLKENDIVVVGGFIGVSIEYKVTTLGRGGSDYSAVLFAHMMGLKEVEIYSDVDGVYDHDPNIDAFAKKYSHIGYDEMLNLKSKVLHDRSVDYAKKHQIAIHLLGTFSKEEGTWIS